jgi:hypothetical protein
VPQERASFPLGLLFSNVVSPGPKGFHNLGEDGCGKWDSNENEGLVDDVCEAELSPDCCGKGQSTITLGDGEGDLQASAPLLIASSAAPISPSLAVASATSSGIASFDLFPASGKARRTTLQKALLIISS